MCSRQRNPIRVHRRKCPLGEGESEKADGHGDTPSGPEGMSVLCTCRVRAEGQVQTSEKEALSGSVGLEPSEYEVGGATGCKGRPGSTGHDFAWQAKGNEVSGG